MEKIKTDILILGDLICEKSLIGGGGKIYLTKKEDVGRNFDVSSACVVEGDIHIKSFDNGDKTVVVCGAASVEGGSYGKQ